MKAYKVYYSDKINTYYHQGYEYSFSTKEDIFAGNSEEEVINKFIEMRGIKPSSVVLLDKSYEDLVASMVNISKLKKG